MDNTSVEGSEMVALSMEETLMTSRVPFQQVSSAIPHVIQPTTSCDPCVIHHGPKVNPKLLSCGHSFCRACLELWLTKSQDPDETYVKGIDRTIECSLCRQKTCIRYDVDDLEDDLNAIDPKQIDGENGQPCAYGCGENTSYFCPDCPLFMCAKCKTIHEDTFQSEGGHSKHKVVHLADDQHSFCFKHPDKFLTFVCLGCDTSFCPICVVTTHRKNPECHQTGMLIHVSDKGTIVRAKEKMTHLLQNVKHSSVKAKCLHKAVNEKVWLKELFQVNADQEETLDQLENGIVNLVHSVRAEMQVRVDEQKRFHRKQTLFVLDNLKEFIAQADSAVENVNTKTHFRSFTTLSLYQELIADLEKITLPPDNYLSSMEQTKVLQIIPGRIADLARAVKQTFGTLRETEWTITPGLQVLKTVKDKRKYLSQEKVETVKTIEENIATGKAKRDSQLGLVSLTNIFETGSTPAVKITRSSDKHVIWRSTGDSKYECKDLFDVTTLCDGTLAALDSAKSRLVFFDQDCTKFKAVKLGGLQCNGAVYALGSLAAIGTTNPLLAVTDTASSCLRLFDVNGACVKSIGEGVVCRPLCSAPVPFTNHIIALDKTKRAILTFDIETAQRVAITYLPEHPRMNMDHYALCCGLDSEIYMTGKSTYMPSGNLAILRNEGSKIKFVKTYEITRPGGLDLDTNRGNLFVCSGHNVLKYDISRSNGMDLKLSGKYGASCALKRGVSYVANGYARSQLDRVAVVSTVCSTSFLELVSM